MLLIEGPLALARRPGSLRIRVENSALTGTDPATPQRVRTWVKQGIGVVGRPEWVFVKVHTHGAPEKNASSLLGEGGDALHRTLAREFHNGVDWVLHYVTAREMYNIAVAAMDGRTGNPAAYRDYELAPPPRASAKAKDRHVQGSATTGDTAGDAGGAVLRSAPQSSEAKSLDTDGVRTKALGT